jgi:hypothetical protein
MKPNKTPSPALKLLCASLLLLMPATHAAAAGVAEGYRTPTFVVPYAVTKPLLDGVIDDAQWQGALSVTALQTVRHEVSARQTRYWLMWDEDNLYVAMRSPLRPGERLVNALRWTDRDVNVVFDDSYEIWIDVGSHSADGQPVFFQWLSNFAGARQDVMEEPAVGNSRLDWTAGWQPKNRITPDGRYWEMELAIPRASIYKTTPFADGFAFTCLLARNYKRPWEQNSVEGTSSFAVRDSHSHFVLSKSAPALHLLGVADAEAKTFGLQLAGFSRTDQALKWRFAGDGGALAQGDLTLSAGRLTTLPPALALERPGKGSYRITVTDAAGQATLLDWCCQRAFGPAVPPKLDDRGDQATLGLKYNPVANYLKVTGDLINFDARSDLAANRVEVTDAAGKVLAGADLQVDALAYVSGVLRLGELAPGQYKAAFTGTDRAGRVLVRRESSFSKKDPRDFPWWHTTLGDADKVLDPWTPVTVKGNEIGVWGRTMTVGPTGLPRQITSQGGDLLARPASLELRCATKPPRVNRISLAMPPPVVTAQRAIVNVGSVLPGITASSQVTVEYDGLYKVELTLTPTTPTQVDSLRAVIPLRPEIAEYLHGSGEGIRYGFDHKLLPRDVVGRLWDSTKVDSQHMVVGSFIPFVFVGNMHRGLAWFADSDQGWVPSDKVPAIELRRDKPDSVDLVLNLIGEPTRLDAPRTITFALQATPVKPMHRGWRMDSWWCGDTFNDYSQVAKRGGDLIWTSLPFTLDPAACAKMVEERHRGNDGFIQGVTKYRANAVPYFENNSIGAQFAPEVDYFGEQWKTSINDSLYYDPTLIDYVVHNLGTWAKECGIDGWYVDNIRPEPCANLEAGRGYRLPDGRIQPTYGMFAMRTLWLRVRAAFAEQGKRDKLVLHTTNHMVIPWLGAGDIAYDGEHNVIYPELGKDFMDYWSLERLRADCSDMWGVAVNFMHEYQGNWEPARLSKAMRAYSGMIILHDALPSGNANGMNQPLWIGRDRFGIEADDVTFLPYWESTGLTSATPDVYLAGWLRPGKLLLAVVNKGERNTAKVTLDAARLGLGDAARWVVSDAEADTKAPDQGPVTADGKGGLSVPVERHDYRQLIIAAG